MLTKLYIRIIYTCMLPKSRYMYYLYGTSLIQ